MNKYEGYREISLPWLKCIPKHWKLVRNKNIFSESKDTVGECFNDYTLLSLTLGGVIIRDLSEGKGKFPKDFETYKIVKQGDIIFCLFDMDETPRTVGLSKNNGMITGAYDVFHINGVNSQFIYYYYLSLDNAKALRPLYSGLRKTIKVGAFLGAKVPLPPRDEQDQIVRFLDWKVSSINRLINIKKKEIKEIESLKKSLIDECVTHGLNPDAPMKDSGVKWLGQIPAHWNNTKINLLFSERKTKVSDKDYLPLSVAKIGVVPQLDTAVKTDAGDNRKLVRSGDFVINSRSDRKGSCGISNFDGSVSLINIVLTPREEMNRNFIHYLMRSNPFSEEFYRYGRGIVGDLWTTRYSEMKNILLPIPPISEQNRIANYIKEKEESFNRFINLLAQQVVCLIELKSRIISDAITGKIDVRDVKIPSFDMVEEDVEDEMLEDNDETDESGEVE